MSQAPAITFFFLFPLTVRVMCSGVLLYIILEVKAFNGREL